MIERDLLEQAHKFVSSARGLDFGEDRVCMWAVHLSADIAAYLASADTHPQGGDAKQAPSKMSGAVGEAETPGNSRSGE